MQTPPEQKNWFDYVWAALAVLVVTAGIATDWRAGWPVRSTSDYFFFASALFFAAWMVARNRWHFSRWLRVAAYVAFLPYLVAQLAAENWRGSMRPLLWVAGACVGIVVVGWMIRDFAYRRSGLLPPAGQATMADVERLVRAGHRILAVRCYRDIHHVDLAEATKAVDGLHVTG